MTRHLHLDTHVVVWMYAGEHDRFPATLRGRLNSESLRFSPMVRLELAYRYETGRIADPPDQIITELATAVGLTEASEPFGRVIVVAQQATSARDPFDRIIAARAVVGNSALATKNERILAAYPEQAVWD